MAISSLYLASSAAAASVVAKAGCAFVRSIAAAAVAVAVFVKSCSMDSRRVAESADEFCVPHEGVGAKADAVARDASRAMEVFIFLVSVDAAAVSTIEAMDT